MNKERIGKYINPKKSVPSDTPRKPYLKILIMWKKGLMLLIDWKKDGKRSIV